MLTNLLPVLICIDLFPIADVPVQDYNRSDNCNDSPQALVVPFHVVEEEADALAIARSIVLTVEKFLRQLFEEFALFELSVIECTDLIVDSRIVFE